MKRLLILISLALAAFSCCESTPESEAKQSKERPSFSGTIPESMKGFELYSWRENDQWVFTLITGTNRLKTYDEITAVDNKVTGGFIKITATGLTEVKSLIDLVPSASSIYWISDPTRVEGFTMPPPAVIDEVRTHCESLHLNLQFIE